MKQFITKALCFVCAGALAVGMAGCGKSASSGASSESTSLDLGSAADYDYQNFTYSDGLDENGYWTGVKALDVVTLPEDYAAIPLKKADIEPTEDEVQSQIDSLLDQHATTAEVTGRAAANGDTVTIDYSGTVDGVALPAAPTAATASSWAAAPSSTALRTRSWATTWATPLM